MSAECAIRALWRTKPKSPDSCSRGLGLSDRITRAQAASRSNPAWGYCFPNSRKEPVIRVIHAIELVQAGPAIGKQLRRNYVRVTKMQLLLIRHVAFDRECRFTLLHVINVDTETPAQRDDRFVECLQIVRDIHVAILVDPVLGDCATNDFESDDRFFQH